MAINKSGDWNVLVLTNAGRDMLTQARAGHKLSFTKIVIGDGTATGTAIDPLTKIKSPRLELPIAKNETVHQGQMRLQFRVSNSKVETGFYFREIGLMATLDDGEELLYSYTTCGSKARMIYDKTYPIQEKVVNIDTITDNAANIKVILDLSIVYATKKDIVTEIDKHREANEIDHPDASVTTKKIRDKNVTTSKLADKSVTAAKLADDVSTTFNKSYVLKSGDIMAGNLEIRRPNTDYNGILLWNKSNKYTLVEGVSDSVSDRILSFTYRNSGSTNNLYAINVPRKTGTLAILSEVLRLADLKAGETNNAAFRRAVEDANKSGYHGITSDFSNPNRWWIKYPNGFIIEYIKSAGYENSTFMSNGRYGFTKTLPVRLRTHLYTDAKDAGDGAVATSSDGDTTRIKVFAKQQNLYYDSITFGLV